MAWHACCQSSKAQNTLSGLLCHHGRGRWWEEKHVWRAEMTQWEREEQQGETREETRLHGELRWITRDLVNKNCRERLKGGDVEKGVNKRCMTEWDEGSGRESASQWVMGHHGHGHWPCTDAQPIDLIKAKPQFLLLFLCDCFPV